MTTLALVPPDLLTIAWAEALPWMKRVVDREGEVWRLPEIKDGLDRGVFQLWTAYEKGEDTSKGYAVTEIAQLKDGKTVLIRWTAGRDLQTWIGHLTGIERWAFEIGAEHIMICGRAGWKRVLAPYGFQHRYTMYTKTVTGEVH